MKSPILTHSLFFFNLTRPVNILFERINKGVFAHFLFASETVRYIARNICVVLLYKVRSKHLNCPSEQSPFETSVLFCLTRPLTNICFIILYKVSSRIIIIILYYKVRSKHFSSVYI